MCIVCEFETKNKVLTSKDLENSALFGITIFCERCDKIESIPLIEGVDSIRCFNCPRLKTIPHINSLIHIGCIDCPLLQTLPDVKNLTSLYCGGCPLLTSVSQFNDLKYFTCDKCPFLYIPYRDRVRLNIQKKQHMIFRLIRAQRRYRLKTMARKILNQHPWSIRVLNDLIVSYCWDKIENSIEKWTHIILIPFKRCVLCVNMKPKIKYYHWKI